jgi:hypothetical protein
VADVVVTEAMAEVDGTTITSTMIKVKRQIAITVEDAVETYMDVVVEAEKFSVITIRNLDIMH